MRQGKVLKREKILIDEGLKQTGRTIEGRAFLWNILRLTGAIGQNPYAGTPTDTAFRCGEQNIGQRLLAHIMEVDHTIYLMMMKENVNEWRTDRDPDAGDAGNTPDLFGEYTATGRADAGDASAGAN